MRLKTPALGNYLILTKTFFYCFWLHFAFAACRRTTNSSTTGIWNHKRDVNTWAKSQWVGSHGKSGFRVGAGMLLKFGLVIPAQTSGLGALL
jgi:hypothetical protein